METKQRITALVGAGAPLDLTPPTGGMLPTTNNITNAVVHKKYTHYSLSPNVSNTHTTNIVEEIYERLLNGFGNDGWKVNFETVFHALESMYSYLTYWKDGTRNIERVATVSPLVFPLLPIDSHDISEVLQPYIIAIMDIVNSYNEEFSKCEPGSDWYRRFWKDYMWWDVFNLNYDTTIEQSIGQFTDGFESIKGYDFKRFAPKKLLSESDELSAVCHPHGCILYGTERFNAKDKNIDVMKYEFHDYYKYPSYNIIKNHMQGSGHSNDNAQDGEMIFMSPIITGLRKTDKLNAFPFDFYNYYLDSSLQKNRSLLIVGYSFGDSYINEWLQRMILFHENCCRVVLIDKWNFPFPLKASTPQDRASLKRWELRDYNAGYNINSPLSHFLCRITGKGDNDQWIEDLIIPDATGPMKSSNGRLMLFTDGFKDAVVNSKQEIYDFLNS